MPKTLWLSGANGFVGSTVLRYVLERTDWNIVAPVTSLHQGSQTRLNYILDSAERRERNPDDRVRTVRCDLSQPFTHALFGGPKPDYIWNIASESHVDRSLANPAPFIRNNVEIAINTLEYAREVEPKLYLNMGTDEVYGATYGGDAHKEWSPIRPSNPYCVAPGTEVLTRHGSIPIEDVKVSRDRILAKGVEGQGSRFNEGVPSRRWEFDYSGEMVYIRTHEGAERITCTPDHKLLIRTTGFSGTDPTRYFTSDSGPRPHAKVEWRRAGDLKKSDRVCVIRSAPFPTLTSDVEKEYARFLGYWIADGSFSSKSRYLRLADQKKSYLEFYRDQASKFLSPSHKSSTGALGTIYKHGTKDCWYYQLSSEDLRSRVDLSDRMNVIEQALNFGPEALAEFVAGWIDGDGSICRDSNGRVSDVSVMSVDDRLRSSLKLMLRRLGVVSVDSENGRKVTVTDSHGLQTLFDLVPSLKWRTQETFAKPQKKRGKASEWIWARISELEKFHYDGKVYDLEVGKYHNYVANYFVSHNSASKAAQEAVCYSYWRAYNVPVVLTNTMNLISPGPGYQHPEKFVPKTIKALRNREPVTIHASPEGESGSRCWLDVRDFASAWLSLTMILEDNDWVTYYPHTPEDPIRYNIVGERASNARVAEMLAEMLGLDDTEYRLDYVNFHESRPGHDMHYALDGTLLHCQGWRPRFTLAETLEDIVRWYDEHPETLED